MSSVQHFELTAKIGHYRLVNFSALVAQAELKSLKKMATQAVVAQSNALQKNTV